MLKMEGLLQPKLRLHSHSIIHYTVLVFLKFLYSLHLCSSPLSLPLDHLEFCGKDENERDGNFYTSVTFRLPAMTSPKMPGVYVSSLFVHGQAGENASYSDATIAVRRTHLLLLLYWCPASNYTEYSYVRRFYILGKPLQQG